MFLLKNKPVRAKVLLLFLVGFLVGWAGGAPHVRAASEEGGLDVETRINPQEIPSVLFTYWEYSAIKDAKKMIGRTRAPTEAELNRDLKDGSLEKVKPPPEKRYITLGGIMYTKKDDWTIWLNGARVTPEALPREVLDLKVYGEYIELKWFDDYSNKIFPLRLRPHERFNIDTRIFLPG